MVTTSDCGEQLTVDVSWDSFPEHEESLKYFFTECDSPLCGECTALGDHRHHQPIVARHDMTKKRKGDIERTVEKLRLDSMPRLEESVHLVDKMAGRLSDRVADVKSDIRAAGDREKAVLASVDRKIQRSG